MGEKRWGASLCQEGFVLVVQEKKRKSLESSSCITVSTGGRLGKFLDVLSVVLSGCGIDTSKEGD